MLYKNIAGRFFGLVTKHACDRRKDGQTDGQRDRITTPKTTLAQLRRAVKMERTRERTLSRNNFTWFINVLSETSNQCTFAKCEMHQHIILEFVGGGETWQHGAQSYNERSFRGEVSSEVQWQTFGERPLQVTAFPYILYTLGIFQTHSNLQKSGKKGKAQLAYLLYGRFLIFASRGQKRFFRGFSCVQ